MLDNKQDNFQLHMFTTSENITKRFRGGTTFTHTTDNRNWLRHSKCSNDVYCDARDGPASLKELSSGYGYGYS